MMNELREEIYNIEENEFTRANKASPMHHSKHEGFAVLLEEYCELSDEMDALDSAMRDLWNNLYRDRGTEIIARQVEMIAIEAACEAVQTAAMARKYNESNKSTPEMNMSPDLWELLKSKKELRQMVKLTYKRGGNQ